MLEETAVVRSKVGEQVVQIEVRPPADPEVDVGIGDVLSFEGLADSILAVTESLNAVLSRVEPKRAAVEFGVDVGVETGGLTALIVKGSGTATLKITLEWERAGS
jgi:NTP-dependent ternary system trypsin peptidase co-occuring protein